MVILLYQSHFQFPPLALLENETVTEMDPNADYLTKSITEHAVSFIKRNKNEPFFLYVPHPIPHKPLHVAPPFMKGVTKEITEKLKLENGTVDYKTRDRLFRQALNEIDWSVGRILDTLKKHGLFIIDSLTRYINNMLFFVWATFSSLWGNDLYNKKHAFHCGGYFKYQGRQWFV